MTKHAPASQSVSFDSGDGPASQGQSGVSCQFIEELTQADIRQLAELHYRVWPKPGRTVESLMERVTRLAEITDGEAAQRPRIFTIREGDRITARATLLPRTIQTQDGAITVGGLAAVASCPNHRGKGLGGRIVRAAFAAIDQGVFPWCLFQTSHAVRPFYEKLGARLIDTPIINSLADDHTAAAPNRPVQPIHPFWDDVAMVYPNREGWPAGPIDLRGPGW